MVTHTYIHIIIAVIRQYCVLSYTQQQAMFCLHSYNNIISGDSCWGNVIIILIGLLLELIISENILNEEVWVFNEQTYFLFSSHGCHTGKQNDILS